MKPLSEKLREYRKIIGVNTIEASYVIGVSLSVIRRIEEDNKYSNTTVLKLCEKFSESDFKRYLVYLKCTECGKDFIPETSREVTCSMACSTARQKKCVNSRRKDQRKQDNAKRYRVKLIANEIAKPLFSLSDVEGTAREEKLSYGEFMARERMGL